MPWAVNVSVREAYWSVVSRSRFQIACAVWVVRAMADLSPPGRPALSSSPRGAKASRTCLFSALNSAAERAGTAAWSYAPDVTAAAAVCRIASSVLSDSRDAVATKAATSGGTIDMGPP